MMILNDNPIFAVLLVAVAAPLLAEVSSKWRVPIVVLEVVLGVLIGPYALGWLDSSPFLSTMHHAGMEALLFMAGMEINFAQIRGRPLKLGLMSWGGASLLAFLAILLLDVVPGVHAPIMVTLALTTTSLGVLLPMLRDNGQSDTPFGRMMMAAGTVGEVGPIVVAALFLSSKFTTWQEFGFLLGFLALVALVAAVGIGARPPKVLALLTRTMHASTQLPIRLVLALLMGMTVLASQLGLESILGAFAAGMLVGLVTRGEAGEHVRTKLDAVMFGWLTPFFFIGTGMNFNPAALTQDLMIMLLVPTFLLMLFLVHWLPMFLYRSDLLAKERLPFALCISVSSLGLVLVITQVGVAVKHMSPEIAQALIAAAMLSLLLFPIIAGVLSPKTSRSTHEVEGD